MNKLKKILTVTALILSILGVVTFTMFILEEAIQMATFGTWPAKNVRDYSMVLRGCDTIRAINSTLKTINTWLGWMQPLAFVSYRKFAEATDYYADALEAEILANAPEVLEGRIITFTFKPETIRRTEEHITIAGGKIHIKAPHIPPGSEFRIKGKVEVVGTQVMIKPETIEPVSK